jgi:hypothetical protein
LNQKTTSIREFRAARWIGVVPERLALKHPKSQLRIGHFASAGRQESLKVFAKSVCTRKVSIPSDTLK